MTCVCLLLNMVHHLPLTSSLSDVIIEDHIPLISLSPKITTL
jgi:hypothetical protein